tara:strand:+ start:2268 stop:2498 length:231 start_codon:yes stop_codon:yes gene_type:complete
MNFRRLRETLIDFAYAFLTLGIIFLVVALDGVFIANIANSLRMTGYLDPTFGVQVILLLVTLVWVPIAILVKHLHD